MLLSLTLSIFAIIASTVSAAPLVDGVSTPPALFKTFQSSSDCYQDCFKNSTCETYVMSSRCECRNSKKETCSTKCGSEPEEKEVCSSTGSTTTPATTTTTKGNSAAPIAKVNPVNPKPEECYQQCIAGKDAQLKNPTPCASSQMEAKSCATTCKLQFSTTEVCPPAEKDVASYYPYSGTGQQCFNECVSSFDCPHDQSSCVFNRSSQMVCSLRCVYQFTPYVCPERV